MTVLLEAILLIVIGLSTFYYLYCAMSMRWFITSARRKPPRSAGGVTLMVPVCGIDEGAFDNWASLCRQDHPDYEVLFGVMDAKDPAVPILEKMIRQFESGSMKSGARRIRLHFCPEALGANHQISNLIHLFKIAENEIIILADSDIRVTPDYLRRVTGPLKDPRVGVVTCGYLDRAPKSLGAAMAAFGRGLDFIPAVLVARRIDRGLKFAIGPTIATRKTVLKRVGGLERCLNRIGSDYHIGRLASEAGFKVELSDYVLGNDCGRERISDVFLRELRWARTIRLNRGLQYYGMGVCYGTVYALPLWWLSGFQAWAAWTMMAVIASRLLQVLVSMRALNAPRLMFWLWALPLRELMNVAIWFGGGFGRRVYWRGRRLRIGVKGVLAES